MTFGLISKIFLKNNSSFSGVMYKSSFDLAKIIKDDDISSRNKFIEKLGKLLSGHQEESLPLFDGMVLWND